MSRTTRSPWRPQNPRPLEAAYLRERAAGGELVVRCDGCGTRGVPLWREVVEGITCERCEECRRLGVVP